MLNYYTRRNNKKIVIIGIYCVSLSLSVLVYFLGGTHTILPSLLFIPISAISILLSRKTSILHAVFFGLLLGPLMPLNTTTGTSQNLLNWVIRLLLFIFISQIIGFLSKKIREEDEQIISQGKKINDAQMTTILSLVKIIELRDDTTGKHVERIAELTKCLLLKMIESKIFSDQISLSEVECISRASSLHDIGKNAIPDRVLLKECKLSYEEFELMKTHTIVGASVIEDVLNISRDDNVFLKAALDIVLSHHEKWDGSGYPKGLHGEETPLTARVVAIVDTYDALRSKRPYKRSVSHVEAISIMSGETDIHFDSRIFKVFIDNQELFENIYDSSIENHKDYQ